MSLKFILILLTLSPPIPPPIFTPRNVSVEETVICLVVRLFPVFPAN